MFKDSSFPDHLINLYIENYKGEITLSKEITQIDYMTSIIKEKDLKESLLYEFFFTNEKRSLSYYQCSTKIQLINHLTSIIQDKSNKQSGPKTIENLKEYLVSSDYKRNELSISQYTTIEKNRLKNISSFKLLTLKMEENFLSIKDDANFKNKADKNISGVVPNVPTAKNENSSYFGFLNNVIQNNNQSITSFISKFTSFK